MEARNDLMLDGEKVVAHYDKIYDHMFLPVESNWDDNGTWVTKNSSVYPGVVWDFGNQYVNGNYFENTSIPNRALVIFDCRKLNYSTNERPKYKITLTLDSVSEARVDSDQGINSNAEWFFDHSSAIIDANGNTDSSAGTEYPQRSSPYKIPQSGGSHSIGHIYDAAYINDNQGAGFITRGFEKDDSRLEGIEIDQIVRDWSKYWLNVGLAIIEPKCLEIAQLVIAAIHRGLSSNKDDAMNPCVSAFTYEFAHAIYQKRGGEFSFTRTVKGLHTEEESIYNEPPGYFHGSYPYIHIQIADIKESRSYKLHYTFRVSRA